MKPILIFFLIITSFVSCQIDIDCCVNIDTAIGIKYMNSSGENLFEREGGYNEFDMNLYYKENNEWKMFYHENLDASNGLWTVEREDGVYLMISPSYIVNENNISESKIEFSDGDFDIIKTEIKKTKSNTVVIKVWYNDVLKWEAYDSERLFNIVR